MSIPTQRRGGGRGKSRLAISELPGHHASMTDDLMRTFVIGMGEVGRRLAGALERAGVEVHPVTRVDGWAEAAQSSDGLRLLCMREQDLAAALERLRGVDPRLLVALQNGWVRPLLGGFPGCGRGLIWFMSKGDHYHPLRPSPFAGPHAEELVRALRTGGLEAVAVDDRELAVAEADKMGFNCVVGLPLAVHGVTLGDYLDHHSEEARAVFSEAVEICAAALGVDPPAGAFDAFVRSVEPLRFVAAATAKALDLRNGAVVRLAGELGLEAPVNRSLLARA